MGLKRKSDTVTQLQKEIINRNHSLTWLVDNLTDGVYLVDPYEKWATILYANQQFTDITGYPNEEIVGRKVDVLAGPETDEDTLKKIREVVRSEKSEKVDILIYHKDGSSFWKELYLHPLYNEQEELFAYMGMQKKITQVNVQNTFQAILDPHATMVSFINAEGIIEETYANSPYIQTVNTFLGKHYTAAVVDEDKEKLIQSFHSTLKGAVENVQLRIYDFNQQIIEINLILSPAYLGQEINGAFLIYRKVRGHAQTNKPLKDAEKYHIVRKMALSTNDIVKPSLETLKGFTALAHSDPSSAPIYADLMMIEIERIEQMVTGYALLSQPHMIKLETKNLRNLLEHVCTCMYTSALKKNITLSLDYQTSREQIKGDKKNLEFLFTQLVKNAIEAMSTGGTISIDVSDYTNHSIRIRVTDEGEGISKETLKKVMEPFYTTKNNQIGLGLVVCKNIIKEHKGLLTLTSKVNKGTVAEVILPFSPPSNDKMTGLKN